MRWNGILITALAVLLGACSGILGTDDDAPGVYHLVSIDGVLPYVIEDPVSRIEIYGGEIDFSAEGWFKLRLEERLIIDGELVDTRGRHSQGHYRIVGDSIEFGLTSPVTGTITATDVRLAREGHVLLFQKNR